MKNIGQNISQNSKKSSSHSSHTMKHLHMILSPLNKSSRSSPISNRLIKAHTRQALSLLPLRVNGALTVLHQNHKLTIPLILRTEPAYPIPIRDFIH